MSPFWNHILGLIHVEIAKIVETWKLAKKDCMQVGIHACNRRCPPSATPPPPFHHPTFSIPPPHLLHSATPPPPFRHPTFSIIGHFIYIPNKYRIHVNSSYSSIIWIHIYIWGLWWHLTHRSRYEFIGGTSHINAACHYCPDQLGCARLPRPVRVRSAAPTS